MRHVTLVLGLGLLLSGVAGCNSTRWNFLRTSDNNGTVKTPDGKVQSVESIVAYLNANAGLVKTIQASSLDVTATQDGQPINLRGKMVAERPRGLRMSLQGPLGLTQVADLGSNNDEFWFWVKGPIGQPAQPQYYCSYKDLEKGVRFMPVPFQPEWVMETLGLGPYGPPERYQLDYDEHTLRLTEKARTPQGIVVRKVIVMRRHETKVPEPQVTHYLLIDDLTNKEICSAHITQTMVVTIDTKSSAILPKKIDLHWRQQNATLSILMDKVAVNVALPPQSFVRQPLSGVQSYNLARGPINGSDLQRAGGFGLPK
jgi:hypothetical protein